MPNTTPRGPYTCQVGWDTTGLATGNHRVAVNAVDGRGKTASSSSQVTVDNQGAQRVDRHAGVRGIRERDAGCEGQRV